MCLGLLVGREALSRGEFPLSADKLVFPAGGTLYFIDTIQAVVSWPIQLVFGPFLPLT